MGVLTLYRPSALSAGSKLWILPKVQNSFWTQLIDWYLNFQISKSQSYQSFKTPEQLDYICKAIEMNVESYQQDPHTPLIISSENLVPSTQVIEMPDIQNPQDWIQMVFKIWKDLGQTSLRVFLPPFIKESDFLSLWPQKVGTEEITLVPYIAI